MRVNFNNLQLKAVLWSSPELAAGQSATVSWRNLEIGPVSWSVPDGGLTLGLLGVSMIALSVLRRTVSR